MTGQHDTKRIVIVGGGMAGLCAGIEAARLAEGSGTEILILDAGERPGNKLYATGNGRCNLTNSVQTSDCYRTGSDGRPPVLFRPGWDQEVVRFMCTIGVLTHERNGYIYPRTDQASTVVQALLLEAGRLGVRVRPRSLVTDIVRSGAGRETSFELTVQESENRYALHADKVILSVGGPAGLPDRKGAAGQGGASGTEEYLQNTCQIAGKLGHSVRPFQPSLCALLSDEPYLRTASGIRAHASVRLYADASCSRAVSGLYAGEIQMTGSGISGIPVFQVSRFAGEGAFAALDFLPEVTETDWELECRSRMERIRPENTLGEFCLGLVPDRIAGWLLEGLGLVREKKIANLTRRTGSGTFRRTDSASGSDAAAPERGAAEEQTLMTEEKEILHRILEEMRRKVIRITGTAGFEKAQAAAGGVRLSEISDHMESRLVPGLYLAGEILDVDGICGGYNLTFALHSGRIAGRSAAEEFLA